MRHGYLAILRVCACLLAGPAAAAPESPAEAAYAASMQGRKADALAAAQRLVLEQPLAAVLAARDSGWELAAQYQVLLRFGLWDELIAQEAPPTTAAGLSAGYLYARGVALAARGRIPEAEASLAQLRQLAAGVPAASQAGHSTLRAVLAVADPVLAARIAATRRQDADAVALLRQAVVAEDALRPGEPPDWFFPVRQLLGAQLLLSGQGADAEAVYREDLVRHPDNGWSLYGLSLAVKAQGGTRAAQADARRFAAAWRQADVRLPGSAFWYEGTDLAACECEHFGSGERKAGGELLGPQHEAGVD
jgi:hypothetical protein